MSSPVQAHAAGLIICLFNVPGDQGHALSRAMDKTAKELLIECKQLSLTPGHQQFAIQCCFSNVSRQARTCRACSGHAAGTLNTLRLDLQMFIYVEASMLRTA